MAKFCRRCGTPLEAGFRFCDMCGAPVVAASRVQPALAAPVANAVRPAWLGPKALKMGGTALGVLCVVALGVYFLTRPAALPQGEALAKLLTVYPDIADLGCVGDFAYAKSPVLVSDFDSHTRRYLDYLVSAGVYAGPRVVTQQSGFFVQRQYEYTHAAGAEKYFRHGKLCMADGLAVSRVDYGERVDDYRYPIVAAHIIYQLKNPAAWATAEAAGQVSRLLPLKVQGEINVPLKYEGKQWSVMSRAEGMAFASSAAAHSRSTAPSVGGWFSNLFGSDPGKPIYGQWRNVDPFIALQMTFARGALGITSAVGGNYESSKVRYTREGETIVVTDDGAESGSVIRVKVISADVISLNMGGEEFHLQRVK